MKKLQALVFCGVLALPSAAQTIIPAPGATDRPGIDVESYHIQASIDPATSELTGVVGIRFVQLDRDDYVVFDLDRRLRVRDVYLGEGEPLPVRFRQFDVDSTLEVDLSELGQFEQPVVRIEYAGRLPADSRDPEGVWAAIDRNSAFLLEEGKWYPMNGVRSDPARMRMDLSVPEGWEVVGALSEAAAPAGFPEDALGEAEPALPAPEAGAEEPAAGIAVPIVPEPEAAPQLVDPDAENPVAAFFANQSEIGVGEPSFSMSSDVPDLWGTVVAGTFERVSPPLASGSVEALFLGGSAAAASELGEAAAGMFRFYSGLFGPPAAPVLRLIEVGVADWEGQSAPGILLLPSSAFLPDYDPWELAQRVATQWFPLEFEVGDPVGDAWIAEGLGVFAALHYFEETLPPADALEYVRRTLVKALSYEGNLTLREAGTLPRESAEYRSLAAYKGAFVFRMLREVMGPNLFGSFLTELTANYDGRPLTTAGVTDQASDVNGGDLAYFFDQWLNVAEVPEFEREYRVLRLSAGGYKVEGQITQDLDLFSMPVEVQVITDGEPEYQTVFVAGPSSDIDIVTERKPRSIVIDPNMKVLRLSPDIRVAVHVSRGEDLADAGEWNAAIDAYQAAIDLDRLSSLAFFRMGEALFELGALQSAADMFREALNGDLEPTWIEVWSYINIGKIYDLRIQRERALIEYEKAVNTGDDAYGAQAEAQMHIERPFRTN